MQKEAEGALACVCVCLTVGLAAHKH